MYDGWVVLDRDGTYRFEIESQAPSRLLVDGRTVVDNPGGSGASTRAGELTSLRGVRRIRVLYAQERPGALRVWVTRPGRPRAELDASMLRGSVFGRGQTGIDAQ